MDSKSEKIKLLRINDPKSSTKLSNNLNEWLYLNSFKVLSDGDTKINKAIFNAELEMDRV